MSTVDCLPCQNNARDDLPDRELVARTEHWRVAHANNTALPGWLVLVSAEHVTTFADLRAAAAAELGPLLHALSQGLTEVVGCVKTYQIQFSEKEGFAHLHIHLVPRATNLDPDLVGPKIFSLLNVPEDQWVPAQRMDTIATELRRFVATTERGSRLGDRRPAAHPSIRQPGCTST